MNIEKIKNWRINFKLVAVYPLPSSLVNFLEYSFIIPSP